MAFVFCPLYSGSSGNCTLVGAEGTHILVDAGLSGKMICEGLHFAGILPETLSGIVITHEHSDHIKGAGILARKYHIPIYANEGTWNAMARQIGEVPRSLRRFFLTGSDFYIGNISVAPFAIPHDAAEPVGFRFYFGGSSVATATDIGEMNKGIINALSGADIVLLESNHDPEMLMNNPHYSMTLKRRILGRFGHLSNDSCAQSVLRLMDTGVGHVVLGHLSAENNTPELAMNTALDTIFRAGLRADEDITVDMAWRDHVGKIYHVETKR